MPMTIFALKNAQINLTTKGNKMFIRVKVIKTESDKSHAEGKEFEGHLFQRRKSHARLRSYNPTVFTETPENSVAENFEEKEIPRKAIKCSIL